MIYKQAKPMHFFSIVWQKGLFGLILFGSAVVLAGCSAPPPKNDRTITEKDLDDRHAMMIDLVVERPKRLQRGLDEVAFLRYKIAQEAFWAAENKKQAQIARLKAKEAQNYDYFMALMAKQEALRAQREKERQERWSLYFQLNFQRSSVGVGTSGR